MNDTKAKSHPLAVLVRLGDIAGRIRDLDYLIPREIETLASERPEFLRISRLRVLSHIEERERMVEELHKMMSKIDMLISLGGILSEFPKERWEFSAFKADLEQVPVGR